MVTLSVSHRGGRDADRGGRHLPFRQPARGKYSVEVAGLGRRRPQHRARRRTRAGGRRPVAEPGPARRAARPHAERERHARDRMRCVRLLKDGEEVRRDDADAKGDFRFTGLAAGTYALAVGDGEPLVKTSRSRRTRRWCGTSRSGGAGRRSCHTTCCLRRRPQPGRREARSQGSCCGWQPLSGRRHRRRLQPGRGEARRQRVTIVGDRVAASAESTLGAAGCQVTRLSGDGYAVAAALAQFLRRVER